ncbi:MAG TPA: hypothetical protein VK752_00120 [Bryobacteraceae bacterium]|jgi:hypothetical protein|nr:hypothetical protein [Bryobacteraceae bacterium]
MTPTEEALSSRIQSLEKELKVALEEKEKAFQYRWANGKALFEKAVLGKHKDLKHWLPSYLLHGRFLAYATAPIIYSGIVPFMLLDVFLTVYQGICFPVYGVPKARRADYIVFDRGGLKYLNLLERLNCIYCSYGNGLLAYGTEIAARTEQHWCPIKHAHRLRAPHSRYQHFLDYGDAQRYNQQVETVRNDFVDLKTLTKSPDSRQG